MGHFSLNNFSGSSSSSPSSSSSNNNKGDDNLSGGSGGITIQQGNDSGGGKKQNAITNSSSSSSKLTMKKVRVQVVVVETVSEDAGDGAMDDGLNDDAIDMFGSMKDERGDVGAKNRANSSSSSSNKGSSSYSFSSNNNNNEKDSGKPKRVQEDDGDVENLIVNKENSPVQSRPSKRSKTSSPLSKEDCELQESVAQFTEFVKSISSKKDREETIAQFKGTRRLCYQSQQPYSTTSSPTTHTSVNAANDGDGVKQRPPQHSSRTSSPTNKNDNNYKATSATSSNADDGHLYVAKSSPKQPDVRMKISSSIPVLGSGSNKSDDPSSSSETSNALQDTANQKKIQGLPPLSPFLSKKKATVEPEKPKNVSSDSNSNISTQQNAMVNNQIVIMIRKTFLNQLR